jgi:signal peptidase II
MSLSAINSKYKKLIGIAGSVVILDQITKAVILFKLPLYHSIIVVPDFFDITHIRNRGAAFGLFANQNSAWLGIFFILISILAIGFVFYLYINTPKTPPLPSTALALIFGGALGNLIDRIRFGEVVDFLDCHIGTLHWPAFNVADSTISIGIAIIMILLVFKKMPN